MESDIENDEEILEDIDDRITEHFTVYRLYMLICSKLTAEEMGYKMVKIDRGKNIGKMVAAQVPSRKVIFENALLSNKIDKNIKKQIIYHLDLIGKMK